MADDEQEQGPSLELPSFGFRRRKKKGAQVASTPEPTPEPTPAPDPDPAPATPEPEIVPPNEPMSEPIPPVQATQPLPPVHAQVVEPAMSTAPAEPAEQPTPAYSPAAVATQTAPADDTETLPEPVPAEGQRKAEKPKRELPRILGLPAAVLVGVIVGLLTVGLTWLSLRLCTLVNGASTCGNAGILLLLAIMVAMIVVGRLLLAFCRVQDPGSTSFLGVGLMAALALLLLMGSLDRWWIVVALPVLAAITFGVSWWVTTSFVEPGDRQR